MSRSPGIPQKIPYNKKVHLKIEYDEVHLAWNKEEGYWELPYREAVSLGLENRMFND